MNHRPRYRRRGSLMVCVLACLAVVVSLVAWMAKDAIAGRRETKIRLQLQQTERLLDAGILRSAIRLKQNANYEGETWNPKFQFAGQPANAAVTISRDGDQTTVTAKIGDEPHITTKSHVYSSSKVQ